MNKFVYYHANKGTPVKQALINTAFDCGILPVKEDSAENFAIIDIIPGIYESNFVLINFDKNRDKLVKYLKESKSRDMILFTYYKVCEDERALPITQLHSDFFNAAYGIIGNIMIPAHEVETSRGIADAIGVDLQLQSTPLSVFETFLSDIAFTEIEHNRHIYTKGSEHDFLVLKYDADINAQKPILQNILIGSNNDYLRVGNTGNFFWATCTFPSARGRRERMGSIMGGNVLNINFIGGNTTFEVMRGGFVKPKNMGIIKQTDVVNPKILNLIESDEIVKLMKYDDELKVFTGTIPQSRANDHRRTTMDEILAHSNRRSMDSFTDGLSESVDREAGIPRHDMGFNRHTRNSTEEITKKVITLKIG